MRTTTKNIDNEKLTANGYKVIKLPKITNEGLYNLRCLLSLNEMYLKACCLCIFKKKYIYPCVMVTFCIAKELLFSILEIEDLNRISE